MNKKIIFSIILLIILISILIINNKKQYKKPDITEIPSRNDTAIIPESNSSTTKIYTLNDVMLHNKSNDCWMIVDNKVIDATSFITSGGHPNNKILNGCGKDATEMFKNVKKHGGNKAQNILINSQIGIIQ